MIDIRLVDVTQPTQAHDLVRLLNDYARHPMGGGEALPESTIKNLAADLSKRPDYCGIMAYDEETAVGLCNCFEGFSTFASKPLMNIHDVYVSADYRGQGIATRMMQQAEQLARGKGCCKITLEVLTRNEKAKASYRASGYSPYQLDEKYGHAEFWQKTLG